MAIEESYCRHTFLTRQGAFSIKVYLLRVDERNSDSYIGRDDFFRCFQEKSFFIFFQAQLHIFAVLFLISEVQFIVFAQATLVL